MTISKPVSALSRPTVACCALMLACATFTSASAEARFADWDSTPAWVLSAVCFEAQPWPASVEVRELVTWARFTLARA